MSDRSNTNDLRFHDLNERIDRLAAIVEKQSQIIGNTGKQLIELQVKNVKSKMSSMDATPSHAADDLSDFVTNEDIVQLVGELQGQLDSLEDRNIGRTFNVQLAEKDSNAKIVPISNKDGEFPSSDIFPSTVANFLSIDNRQIIMLSEFYELIIPTQEQERIKSFIESEGQVSLEDAQKLLTDEKRNPQDLDTKLLTYTNEQFDELHDDLARYLGLKFRRIKSNW